LVLLFAAKQGGSNRHVLPIFLPRGPLLQRPKAGAQPLILGGQFG